MDQVIKEAWAAALESGLYKQGNGFLHTIANNEYCCLGVLCDLAVIAGVVREVPSVRGAYAYGPVGSASEDDVDSDWQRLALPTAVMEWAGLMESDPEVRVMKLHSATLSVLNDGDHTGQGTQPFTAIAKLIREQL